MSASRGRRGNHRRALTVLVVLALPLVIFVSAVLASDDRLARTGAADQAGEWGPVLDWGISGKHMALLATGDVLVWRGSSGGDNARVWDPDAGAFTPVPAAFGSILCSAQATLGDGRVIVLGGQISTFKGIKVTLLFDPFANTWTKRADMAFERWYGTATTLPDGRVLATSGTDVNGTVVSVPEIYDPVADTWTTLTGANRAQDFYPFMYVLPNGTLYEAGTGAATWYLSTGGTGSWTAGPINAFGTKNYSESGAMYAPGKIIRSGGGNPAMNRTAIIDMNAASPTWKETAGMAFPRRRHNMVILADGSVIAVGGTGQADDVAAAVLEAEIWDPATESWTTVAPMTEARMYHSTALLLPDGRVVAAGGEASGELHAQIYSPPYLFKGARPTIDSAPASAVYGSSFSIATPDAVDIAAVSVIRPGAVTHAIDMNQRYVPLSFTPGDGSLTVEAPVAPELAPPGYYLLVIENGSGVPSVARWIRLEAPPLQPGEITGTVTDAGTVSPIAGATVSYSGGSATTDANGEYRIDSIASGNQTLTASATGYATMQKTVSVPPNGSVVADFALTPAATYIAGEVRDAVTTQPIAGATVSFSGGSTQTDSLGRYRLENPPPGTYDVAASANGYVTKTQQVVVTTGVPATSDFALQPVATSALKDMTFEGGRLVDASTGADAVKGAITVETAAPINGVYSAAVAGGNAYLEERFTSTSDLYMSFYLRMRSLPSSQVRLLQIWNGSAMLGRLLLTPAGKMRLLKGSSKIGSDSAPLVVGRVYRIALHQRAGAGGDARLEGFLTEGAALFGAPFAATGSGTWTTAADRLRLGSLTSSVVRAVVDDVRLAADSMPAP